MEDTAAKFFPGPQLTEREEQLGQLLELASVASHGKGSIVLVSGEAGIGKTALLHAFRCQIEDALTTLWGSCDDLFTPRPFGPLYDMAPGLGGDLGTMLDDNAPHSRILNILLRQIADIRKPAAFVFEDAHWADHATLDFLKALGRRIPFLNCMLVISFREDEVNHAHPLAHVLGALPPANSHRIALPLLSKQAVREMAAGMDVDQTRLHSITGGNPFFVTELLATLGPSNDPVPVSVQDSVNARLHRLRKPQRDFLQTLSVTPAAISGKLIQELSGDEGNSMAMVGVSHRFLAQDGNGEFRFHHELSRLAILSSLNPFQQQQAHGRMLEALMNVAGTPVDLLVHHAAGALRGEKVLELAPGAAQIAARTGAHYEAAKHLQTAIGFVDEAQPELAARLYEKWAYEAGVAVEIDDKVLEARRLAITLWRSLGRYDRVGENLCWLSRLHWSRGEAAKANHFSKEAVQVLETTQPTTERAMAYSYRSQLHLRNDRMEQAVKWGQKALSLAEDVGSTEARIHALNNIGTAMVYRGENGGEEMLEQSLALALGHGFHEHAARVYTNLASYAVDFRKFEQADEVLDQGIAFDTGHDLDSSTQYLVGLLARLRLEQGWFGDAERIAKGVLKLDRLTLLIRMPAALALSRVRMRQGAADAMENLKTVLADAVATDEVQYIIPARYSLVEHAWLHDLKREAHSQLVALSALDTCLLNPWNDALLQLWARRAGLDVGRRKPDNLPPPIALELAGDGKRAGQAWLATGASYDAALTYISCASEDPVHNLGRALAILQPMGASLASERARRLARDLGVAKQMPARRRGLYGSARAHPLSLTKREQEILKLMLEGASNREIAQTLSRSQRTVEHHVSAILSKLGVSSRMEAMLRVQDEPWICSE